MGERTLTIITCDYCTSQAKSTITFKLGGKTAQLDLCADHLSEVRRASHPAIHGKRKGQYA